MHTLTINHPGTRRPHAHLLAALATLMIALSALGTTPEHAAAGTYTVSGTCAWEPYNQAPANLTVYSDGGDPTCPGRVARNVGGNFNTGAGPAAGWQFISPPGSEVSQLSAGAEVTARAGWQAGVVTDHGDVFNCTSNSCPGGFIGTWSGFGATALYTRVRCGAAGGCYNGQTSGYFRLLSPVVTVRDSTAPGVSAGGDLAAAGWKGGTPQLVVDANDNVGIKHVQALIDGRPVAGENRPCNYAAKVPCPNGPSTLAVPVGGASEGPHTLTVQALDSADNSGGADRTIYIDNTAPVSPTGATVEGGSGWRSQNAWKVSWENPPQKFAPITGARYILCPPEADSKDPDVAAKARKECVTGGRGKNGLGEISDLKLPAAGAWNLRLFLVDSAGNANPDTAAKITGLGFDPTPPAVAGFAKQDPNDPARALVKVAEDASPIIGGAIEVRRKGEQVWRPLATEVGARGISAFVDDETLRRGRYELRATVTNAAGLQQGTDRRTDGTAATLTLPIRTQSKLSAGRSVGKACRGRSARRRCRQRLRANVGVALGRRVTLRGRLTAGDKPIKAQPLEVWQRVSVAGAAWARIGTVQTRARGRFLYKTAKGPARRLRFRYPGNELIRGDTATVSLRVHAKSTMRVSHRNVINGEYVTFSGQLRGGLRPAGGVLVELQVRSRGHWRTFAQPRADTTTGQWSYQYRFATVSSSTRFRFRATVRRQAGFPFATGHSRTIGVTVHGL
jgi:hypothetical protein